MEFVSIAMPALNEAGFIAAAIASVMPDEEFDFEILVVDGGSTDHTIQIVEKLASEDPRIRLIHNPKRTQAAAVNLAALHADARCTVLVRADCHAEYPKNFVRTCLAALRDKRSASVVVPMLTVGKTSIQRAIAAAQNSRLGNGGSAHRLAGSSGYVDHGHHAAFDREIFTSVGGYNSDMSPNEDAELDVRIRRAGHRIWLCGAATITYFPRGSFSSLAIQYYRYGWARARTALRHRLLPQLRQLIPLVALAGCVASVLLSFVHPLFLSLLTFYLLPCLAWGAVLALKKKSAELIMAGPAAIIMHLAWAVGFAHHLLAQPLQKPDTFQVTAETTSKEGVRS